MYLSTILFPYLDWRITKDIYDKKHQDYHDKIQLSNIELEEHTKADYDYQTTVASVLSVARRAKAIFESSEPAEQRVFLNYLLQNPTVKEKTLGFTLRSPFNLVLELADSPTWLRGQDSNLEPSPYTWSITFVVAWTISFPRLSSDGISVSSLYGAWALNLD